MSKNQSKIHLLPIILAVLLVAALGGCGWLFTQNSDLRSQVTTLQDEISALNGNAADADAELSSITAQLADVQAELAACQSDLAGAQAALAEAQDALALAAAVQADADQQIIALNAALDACNAELAKISADKEAADAALAALGYGRITPPVVVEPLPEETFGETPAEEYVTPTITVYTAEALGLAFEGPLEWVIATDSDTSDNTFVLREETKSHGVYTQLTLTAMELADAPADEQLATFVADHYGIDAALGTPVTLMGAEGLQLDLSSEPEQGVTIVSRAHVAVVDGTLYAVEIASAPEWFDAAVNSVFQPVCESIRIVP